MACKEEEVLRTLAHYNKVMRNNNIYGVSGHVPLRNLFCPCDPIVTIKDGVCYHNGNKLRASDVIGILNKYNRTVEEWNECFTDYDVMIDTYKTVIVNAGADMVIVGYTTNEHDILDDHITLHIGRVLGLR